MAELTAHQRDDLSDRDFALPGRRYPIHDEDHARAALSRIAQFGTDAEKAKVRAAVKKRFPNIAVAAGGSLILHDSAFLAAADPASTLPKDIDGQPVAYFEKELMHAGPLHDRRTNQVLEITPERMDRWVENFDKWTSAGNAVPLPTIDHFADNEKLKGTSLGYLLTLERRGDSLYGLHQFIGDDAIKAASRNGSSVFVEPDKIDGAGNHYDEVLTHNLITPRPLVPGLQPFQRIAASYPVYSDYESPSPPTGATMLMKKIKEALGLGEDATDEHVHKAMEKHMAIHRALNDSLDETRRKLACAETDLAAARTTIAASQAKMPDDYTLGLISESLATKREKAVIAAGPEVLTQLDGLFMAEGKPTPLALSQVQGKTLLGRVYDVISNIPPAVKPGRVTFAGSAGSGAGDPNPAAYDPSKDAMLQRALKEKEAMAKKAG